ncbi:hypothetical protein DFH06DRAFT_69132 [Mycena polygramma]|nr:hypothetical protein DFH06DRAFT_69132 [Mycena polygramma]
MKLRRVELEGGAREYTHQHVGVSPYERISRLRLICFPCVFLLLLYFMPRDEFPAIAILAENSHEYLIQWAGLDKAGKPWPNNWEPKCNANSTLREGWRAKKKKCYVYIPQRTTSGQVKAREAKNMDRAMLRRKTSVAKKRAQIEKPAISGRPPPAAPPIQPDISTHGEVEAFFMKAVRTPDKRKNLRVSPATSPPLETFLMQSVSITHKRKSLRASRAQQFFQSSPGSLPSPATSLQSETHKAPDSPQKRPHRRARRQIIPDSDTDMESPENGHVMTEPVEEYDSLTPHSPPHLQLQYSGTTPDSPSAARPSISPRSPDNSMALTSTGTTWLRMQLQVDAANPNKGIKGRMRPRDPAWRGHPL